MKSEVLGLESVHREDDFEVLYSDDSVYTLISDEYAQIYDDMKFQGIIDILKDYNILADYEEVDDFEGNETSRMMRYTKFRPTYCFEWSYRMIYDAAALITKLIKLLKDYGLSIPTVNPYWSIDFMDNKPVYYSLRFIKGSSNISDEFFKWYLWPLNSLRYNSSVVRNILKTNCNDIYSADDLVNISKGIKGTRRRDFINRVENRIRQKTNIRKAVSKKTLDMLKDDNPMKGKWFGYQVDYKESDDNMIQHARGKEVLVAFSICEGVERVLEFGGNRGLFAGDACKNLPIKNFYCTDYDEQSVDRIYRRIREGKLNSVIHPLVINFEDTFKVKNLMAIGQRIKPDLLIMMALTHHLLLAQNIDIAVMFRAIKDCTEKYLLIEFMPKGMWDGVHTSEIPPEWYTTKWFKENMEKYFDIKYEKIVSENRLILLGERRISI